MPFINSDTTAEQALTILNTYAPHPECFRFLSDTLLNNKSFMLAAVKINGLVLEHGSNKIKNNSEIVLAAVEQNEEAFDYAAEELRKRVRSLKSTSVKDALLDLIFFPQTYTSGATVGAFNSSEFPLPADISAEALSPFFSRVEGAALARTSKAAHTAAVEAEKSRSLKI